MLHGGESAREGDVRNDLGTFERRVVIEVEHGNPINGAVVVIEVGTLCVGGVVIVSVQNSKVGTADRCEPHLAVVVVEGKIGNGERNKPATYPQVDVQSMQLLANLVVYNIVIVV